MNLDPKGFYWSETETLDLAQRRMNAQYIHNTLVTDDWAFMCPGHESGDPGSAWTIDAIAAFLGNVRVESWINPGIYQGLTPGQSNGYGLVQWTPGTLLRDWAEGLGYPTYDIDVQLARLQYESDQGIEWYPRGHYTSIRTFKQFTQGTYMEELTGAFWVNYLRSAASSPPDTPEYEESLANRINAAESWYDFLVNNPPVQPWRPWMVESSGIMYYSRRARRRF